LEKREKGNKKIIESLSNEFNVDIEAIEEIVKRQYEFVANRIRAFDLNHIDIPEIGQFKPRYTTLVHYRGEEFVKHPYDKEKQRKFEEEGGVNTKLEGNKLDIAKIVDSHPNIQIHLNQNGTRFKGYKFGFKEEDE